MINGVEEVFVLPFSALDYEYLFWKFRLTRLKSELWCTCFITKTEVLFFLSLCSRLWFLGENSLSQLSRFAFLFTLLFAFLYTRCCCCCSPGELLGWGHLKIRLVSWHTAKRRGGQPKNSWRKNVRQKCLGYVCFKFRVLGLFSMCDNLSHGAG